MLAKVWSAATHGIDAVRIVIEVDAAQSSQPGFTLVGLPDAAVREAYSRVRSALHNCGFWLAPRYITVNLSPADVKKEGSGFDLLIALGILNACELLDEGELKGHVFVGELSLEESIVTTKIHSVAGTLPSGSGLLKRRPFRAPHHTISTAGLVGGGTIPRPGEVSLAHHGVLFLDELAEFRRDTLEVLRQPMDDGIVAIARASRTVTYPSRFTLATALNPCPCGFFNDERRDCICSPQQVARYLAK